MKAGHLSNAKGQRAKADAGKSGRGEEDTGKGRHGDAEMCGRGEAILREPAYGNRNW